MNIPDSQYFANRAVVFLTENKNTSMKKITAPEQPIAPEKLKYHCVKMPNANGMSKRKNGASLQTGT